jgi:hypothetical protein
MSAAVIVPNPLPAEIVALSAEAGQQIDALIERAACVGQIASPDTYAAADAVVGECAKLAKAIEAERKRIKEPITALARALDDAAGEALAPLLGIKAELGRQLLAYQAAENARRAEEARRIAELRAAAEAKARAEQEELNRARREAEAARLAAEMAQEVAQESGVELPPWEQPEPLPEVPAAVVVVPEYIAPAAPLLKSSSVVRKMVKRVEITDKNAVPRELNGVPLWILDIKQIEKLAKAGLPIPGVTVSEVETLAAKG